jgi:hypothetical protein
VMIREVCNENSDWMVSIDVFKPLLGRV